MTQLVFVHGTGVREESYLHSLERIEQRLADRPYTVHSCYWGELGAELHGGASIPGYEKTPDEDREREVAVWGLLYEDPLYKLRLLALREGAGQGGMGRSRLKLVETARTFRPDAELAEKLEQAGLDETFIEARAMVTGSEAFSGALGHAPEALGEYRTAIAQAFLCQALALRTPDDASERRIEAQLRDEIVDRLVDSLGGDDRAFDWLTEKAGKLLLGVGSRVGTWYAQRRRSTASDAGAPIAGDILLYQARGERIRDFIRQRLAELEPPVVLLAHSLGGIACVDLLNAEDLDVELLVTVGSQAPFLYEIGALCSLELGQELPDHFPDWLNIWDPRDFLSYIGAGVFPDRVRDVEVDNRQPFPAAHSAYWENPEVWAAIDGALNT